MGVDCRITMLDSYGRSATKGVETTETLYASAVADIAAYLAALHAVSDLGWNKQDYLLAGLVTQAAEAGSNRDVGATLKVVLDNSKNYAFKIPGIKASMLNADGTVKILDAAIVALTDLFLTGGKLRVSEGNFITAVLSGSLDK